MGRKRKTDRQSPRTEQEKLDEILALLSCFGWTLGYFLLLLFSDFRKAKDCTEGDAPERTPSHAGFVSAFLSRTPKNDLNGLQNILSIVYNHPMARHQMLLWAVVVVRAHVIKEAANLANLTTGLHLPVSRQDWENVVQFSLQVLQNCVLATAPVLYSLVLSVATSPYLPLPATVDSSVGSLGNVRSRDPNTVC
jgi:hypothetical protein